MSGHNMMHAREEVKGRGPAVKINRSSGAVYLFGERRFDDKTKPLEEKEYLAMARTLIGEKGLTEKEVSEPAAYRMMTQSRPKEGKRADIQRLQKNVVITFKRQIMLDWKAVPVVGGGGVISVQLNNDGSLYNASKVWRTVKGVKRTTKSKPYEQAYREALAEIGEGGLQGL